MLKQNRLEWKGVRFTVAMGCMKVNLTTGHY